MQSTTNQLQPTMELIRIKYLVISADFFVVWVRGGGGSAKDAVLSAPQKLFRFISLDAIPYT